MTYARYKNSDSALSRRERIVLSSILCFVGALTAFDVLEDWKDGASLRHIVPEVLIICFTVGVALYLLGSMLKAHRELIEISKRELSLARAEAQTWRSKAQILSKGITDAISEQFESWGLSPAEKEVSFLLIKGLSIQEASAVRQTSERTIRQQASEVYKKSGLSGRAQLSAFFLEDLFERNES